MATMHDIPEIDSPGLRRFAFTMAAIVAVLFGLFFPWLLERPIPRWPWIFAALFVTWGLAAPATLRPVYRGWMRFGLLLNKVTSPLIMGIVFYLVVTPMGLIWRLFGSSLPKSLDKSSATYRKHSEKSRPEDLERPF